MKRRNENGSDITPFSRSDVHSTPKIKERIVEAMETGTEFKELRGGEGIRGRSEQIF